MAEAPLGEVPPTNDQMNKATFATGVKPKLDIDTAGVRSATRDVEAFDKAFENLFKRLDTWVDKRAPILEKRLGIITDHMQTASGTGSGSGAIAVSQQLASAKESADRNSLFKKTSQSSGDISTDSGTQRPANGQGLFARGQEWWNNLSPVTRTSLGVTSAVGLAGVNYFNANRGVNTGSDLAHTYWSVGNPNMGAPDTARHAYNTLNRGLGREDIARAVMFLSPYGAPGSAMSNSYLQGANTLAGIVPGMGVADAAQMMGNMTAPTVSNRMRMFGIQSSPGGISTDPTHIFRQVDNLIWGSSGPTLSQASTFRPGTNAYTSAQNIFAGDADLMRAYQAYSQSNAAFREQGGEGFYDPTNSSHRSAIGVDKDNSYYETQRDRDYNVGGRDEQLFYNNRGSLMFGVESNRVVSNSIREIADEVPGISSGLAMLSSNMGALSTIMDTFIKLAVAKTVLGSAGSIAGGTAAATSVAATVGKGSMLAAAAPYATVGIPTAFGGDWLGDRVYDATSNRWVSTGSAVAGGAAIGAAIGALGGPLGSGVGAALGGTLAGATHLIGSFMGDAPYDQTGGGTTPYHGNASNIPENLAAGAGVSQLNPEFKRRLAMMFRERPQLQVTVGYRSYAEQERLFRRRYRKGVPSAIDKKGTLWKGERWYRHLEYITAPPGRSLHGVGLALDLSLGPGDAAWVAANHQRFGLKLPMPSAEPWHLELPISQDERNAVLSGQRDGMGYMPEDGFEGPGGVEYGSEHGGGGSSGATLYGSLNSTESDIFSAVFNTSPTMGAAGGGGGGGGASASSSPDRGYTPFEWSGGTLSAKEIYNLARTVGFDHNTAELMTAISWQESRFNPMSHNPHGRDNSYGLWQINMKGELGPGRRAAYGLKSNEELFNPITNAKAAWTLSGGGNIDAINKHWSATAGLARADLGNIRNQINSGGGDAVDIYADSPTSSSQPINRYSSSSSHTHNWTIQVNGVSEAEAARLAQMVMQRIEEVEELNKIGAY